MMSLEERREERLNGRPRPWLTRNCWPSSHTYWPLDICMDVVSYNLRAPLLLIGTTLCAKSKGLGLQGCPSAEMVGLDLGSSPS